MEHDMKQDTTIYASKLPYPEIKVEHENATYAKIMLDNMASDHSEMSAVASYFYNALVTGIEEVTTTFHKISMIEMHHLQIFGELAVQLGENPRLWTVRRNTRAYWTPGYIRYPVNLKDLLHTALSQEEQTIHIYQQQSEYIDDHNIRDILNRIIKDEMIHVEIFKTLIKHHCS